jgi:hypothetical protein
LATPSASNDFSKADIAGRYSPDPTNANDPFIESFYDVVYSNKVPTKTCQASADLAIKDSVM